MNKSLLKVIAPLALLGCVGCKLQVPESVSVKTDAVYKFSIGEIEKDLSDYFSPSDMISTDGMPASFSVYDYYPVNAENRDSVQQFLFSFPVTDIPVSISDYFSKTDLASEISGMNFNQSFTVPSTISSSQEKTVDLTSINNAINSGVLLAGYITANSDMPIVFAGSSVGVSFTSISYTSGNMVITANVPNGKKATLKSTTGTGWSSYGTFENNVCNISLNGKTIYSTGMTLAFDYGTGSTYTAVIDSGSKIKKAVDVVIDSSNPNAPNISVEIDAITIPNSDNDTYKSCVIGSGSSLNATVQNGFSGLKYQVLTSGGLSITAADCPLNSSPKNINLEDKVIIPEDITITPTVKLDFSSPSTINFENPPKVVVETSITSFKSLTAILENADKLKVQKEQALSDSITGYVEKIVFNECGLKGTYKNTFPTGNDITITSTCGFFFGEGNSKNGVLASGTSNSSNLNLTETNHTTLIGGATGYKSVNFTATLGLPGQNASDPSVFTLVNVTPNSTYSIEIALESCLDWKSISLKTQSVENKVSTGLNLAEVFNAFDSSSSGLSNLALNRLPVYLYFEKPDVSVLNDAAFKGTLKAVYVEEKADGSKVEVSGVDPVAFLDGTEGNNTMKLVSLPDLKAEKLSESATLSTTTVNLDEEECSSSADLAPLSQVSTLPDNSVIYINYDLALTDGSSDTFTIYKTDLSSNTDASIGINAFMVLPLELKVTSGLDIDLLSWMGLSSGTDLFGRSEASSSDTIDKAMGVIESVGIRYEFKKMPFNSSNDIELVLNLGDEEKRKSFQSGFLGVERETVKYMLDTYPFSPTVKLSMAENTVFSVPREIGVDLKIALELETNGTLKLYEKQGGEE